MPQKNCTVAVAAISACASVVVYEILRRLASWAMVDEQEEKTTDVCESDALPDLGKSLRAREYSLDDNLHPLNNGSYGGVPQRVLRAQKRFVK